MADVASVTVRYFAAAAEAAGIEQETLAASEAGATVGELRERLVERYGPTMARVVANGSFLVDGIVRRDASAALGSNVDVLPPFAGG
ncbi:molybdopterin converting factor small subunit [Agromyces sp. 3263]|uniref:MoaD/ThiS family protein n=1 Tax=Agromyces sp. 3263 TaxID=2817750 RepID=UPI00285F0B3F|nr:MoaD/ThiS family protein [Agromyces sp. 3263]MDR6906249.1 molybdopterin converting factor small subunit [Agromyces sp. 3263]